MSETLISATTPLKQLEAIRAGLDVRAFIFPDAATAAEAVAEIIRLRLRLGEGVAAGHKRVTLCGSARFAEQFAAWHARLMLEESALVYTAPNLAGYGEQKHKAVKDRIDLLWFAMIEQSDEVFVIDVEGYVGESTAEEIAFARERGIPVRFLSQEEKADVGI